MRAIILILILLVVVAIGAVATGFIDVSQTRPAAAPQVSAGSDGVVAKGGQTPAFKVETGQIEVGTGQRTIPVPEIRVAPGGDAAQQPTPPAPQAQPQAQPQPTPPATTDSTQR